MTKVSRSLHDSIEQVESMTLFRTSAGAAGTDPITRGQNFAYHLAGQVGAMPHESGGAVHGHHHPNDGMGAVMNQFSTLTLPGGPGMTAASNMGPVSHHYCGPQEQPMAYQGYSVPVQIGMAHENAYAYGVPGAQYPVQSGFAPLPVPYHAVPFTPGRVSSYGDRSSEVPGLDNRRGSYSTTESAPATPFFGSASERGAPPRIALVRSAYNTPSPEQTAVSGMVPKAQQPVDEDLLALLKQDPAVPDAVPAVFTPASHTKSIDQCLENRIQGNRNVYIRGLHPTTDDDLLAKYALRFGKVEQSKAIIDTSTGACKGFGFAKFLDVRDSEKCIRGFYALGYEVGFARESFNARLKAEGDDNSTNLYLSNLPKRLTEAELNGIFGGYHVVSSKILRDSMGNSRGVGFARFDSREECEDVIKKFHGASVGEEGMLMQVRYADTPAQKELKRITSERRQFRTNEYNIGAYGTADVGIHPSIYNTDPWNRRPAALGAKTSFALSPVRVGPCTHGASLSHGGTMGQKSVVTLKSSTSDDGSADEGATIVDPPAVAHGSTQSSPTAKKDKA